MNTTINNTATQVQTLGNSYTLPPQEVINQVGISEKITHEFCFAHPVCDSHSKILHFGALCWPNRYAITAELKEYAQQEYERMKSEKIASLGNKLVFVGMGMSYDARYTDDICNHRIRTEIINPEGRRFFIELGTGRGDTMRFDHVVDRDQEINFDEMRAHFWQKIQDLGGFYKVPSTHPVMINYRKYESQPYYWYKKDDWYSLNVQYTRKNVLIQVNKLFGCNFTEMEVCNYLLSTDDYTSISPKS